MSHITLKQRHFLQTTATLQMQGFIIAVQDQSRPWGGFFVIEEAQVQQFSDLYFAGLSVEGLRVSGRLSPKFLLVAPGQRLSWQYHHRRAGIWRVVQGPVGVATSDTDEEQPLKSYRSGEQITLRQGERHRLVGLGSWGIVAEIWQ